MTDAQLQCFLERLRAFHGATRVRLEMIFEDGTIYQEAVEELTRATSQPRLQVFATCSRSHRAKKSELA